MSNYESFKNDAVILAKNILNDDHRTHTQQPFTNEKRKEVLEEIAAFSEKYNMSLLEILLLVRDILNVE